MALKPCVGCSHLLSDTARRCPKCGVTVIKKSSSVRKVVGSFLLIGAVILPAGYIWVDRAQQQKQVALNNMIKEELTAQQWQYSRTKLGSGETQAEYAHLMSSNRVQLKYPYEGEQQGYLSVMKTAGSDLVISTGVLSGQLNCASVPCQVSAKFDDAPAQKFTVSFPKDGAQDTVLITEPALFIEQLKHSKRLQLELEFYQDGPRQLEFALLDFPLQ